MGRSIRRATSLINFSASPDRPNGTACGASVHVQQPDQFCAETVAAGRAPGWDPPPRRLATGLLRNSATFVRVGAGHAEAGPWRRRARSGSVLILVDDIRARRSRT